MTLLIFRYPALCLGALVCGGLSALAARRGTARWFWLCSIGLTALVTAALACMIPYAEVAVLLLPAVYGALFSGRREGQP